MTSRFLIFFFIFAVIAQLALVVTADECLKLGEACDFVQMVSTQKDTCCEPYGCFPGMNTCVDLDEMRKKLDDDLAAAGAA
nr:venom peptide [Acharia stimulea]